MFDVLSSFYARRRIYVSPFPHNQFQQGPKHIPILLRNLSVDAKDHKILLRYADLLCCAGNGMTFPRCSGEIHFPLRFRNFSGT
jgi:hypothetical protein